MFRSFWKKFKFVAASAAIVFSTSLVSLTTPQAATAATLPATVSADALPTVQINGVVLSQVTVGNTVYATGDFTEARPAGSPAGSNETARKNLLAYDITTGNLIASFNHSVNGVGKVVTASPDGKRLYIGGEFTRVDGATHNHIAAIDLTTNKVIPAFATDAPNNTVLAIAVANNGTVYAGGGFTQTTQGSTRSNVVSYTAAGALSSWAPSVNAHVVAVIVTQDQSKVVLGGSFSTINGQTYHTIGAVTASTGAPVAWASQASNFAIRGDEDPVNDAAGITSFSQEAGVDQIFLTAFNFISSHTVGGFEGRASISPVDGHIIWLNDCHGDTYSSFPVGSVLYSVGHSHDCQPAGAFPEVTPRVAHRALAETITADGVNGPGTNGYWNHQGEARSTQLNWYPQLEPGTFTGQNQAAWSVTGNASYIALGGEFPTANGVAQQGLVRYAIRSIAPNNVGPAAYKGSGVALYGLDAANHPKLVLTGTSDEDDASLTYNVYRDGGSAPIYTAIKASPFWAPPQIVYIDKGATGINHTYKLVATDSSNHSVSTVSEYDDRVNTVYSGSWISQANLPTVRDSLGNEIHFTSKNGGFATITFTGTSIKLITEKSPNRGTMTISLDGGTAATADAHTTALGYTAQQVIYSKSGLANTKHTLKVTKTGGTYLVIDGYVVN